MLAGFIPKYGLKKTNTHFPSQLYFHSNLWFCQIIPEIPIQDSFSAMMPVSYTPGIKYCFFLV